MSVTKHGKHMFDNHICSLKKKLSEERVKLANALDMIEDFAQEYHLERCGLGPITRCLDSRCGSTRSFLALNGRSVK